MNITIEATAAALNQFCNQQAKKINQTLRNGMEFENMFSSVRCSHTYTEGNIQVNDVLQPYQAAHTPNNAETLNAVSHTLQHGKVDMKFDALQLEKFFDTYYCDWFEMDKDPKQWTFPRYIMQEVIMSKVKEEMGLTAYSGVRVEPTAGTAGTFLQTFDGLKKKFEDGVLAGDVTPIATGAFTETTIVDQIDAFCKQLPTPYRYLDGIICMSMTNAQMYADNYKVKYPTREVAEKTHDTAYLKVDQMNKRIKGFTCMEGSDRIFIYFPTRKNIKWGSRTGQSVMPRFRFQVFDRTLKVLSEVSRFYGPTFWEETFINDQV